LKSLFLLIFLLLGLIFSGAAVLFLLVTFFAGGPAIAGLEFSELGSISKGIKVGTRVFFKFKSEFIVFVKSDYYKIRGEKKGKEKMFNAACCC
jgi:hypothetical protein